MPGRTSLGGGGDTSTNPLKTDAELQVLLKQLDGIKKYKKFQGWKAKFLDRLETFLYEEGMVPAQQACNDYDALLKSFVKRTNKVTDFMDKGDLSETKKTVKAALSLNEMCNNLTGVVTAVQDLIPFTDREEKKRGFTKFHLGAVLIRQGFHQYVTMKDIEAALTLIGDQLETVADKQQHELFHDYEKQVQRFCDVMADLNLYEIMMKCIEFLNEPEDESEGPEAINLIIKTHDGKTIRVELDADQTIGALKDAISDGCGLVPDKQVLKYLGDELADDTKTLEDLEIPDGATMTVEPHKVPITVRLWDGRTLDNIMIDNTQPMSTIKKQLEEDSGLTADNMKLSMNGISLGNTPADDAATAEFYGIKEGSVLDLAPKTIKVNVVTPDGETHEVDLGALDDANQIKAKIEAATGMIAPRQVLKLDGKEIPDDGTSAKEMGLVNGSTIHVEVFKVPVTVNTMDGKKIQVMVDPTDTLSAIKADLEAESGLPSSNQRLFKDGNELDDDGKTAADYGIEAGSELDLEPKTMQVSVKTPDGKTHSVEVTPSDTSEDLKNKIEQTTGMKAPTQVVKFQAKEIPDGKTLKEVGVQDGSSLDVELFKVPITVTDMDGRQIKVMVDPTDTLGNIKKQLADESGLSPDNQKLFMGGDELADDGKTAQEYGIQAGSELDLEPKSIKVTVETPDGKIHEVDIAPSDTSDDIKTKIEAKTGMKAPTQVLKKGGKELPEGRTVKDMGIREGDKLSVEVFRVPVTVNTMDGKQIKVMVDPTDTLGAIKQQLADESGLSPGNQRLFMGGDELADDGKTAEDYGIKAGSELDLEPKNIKVLIETPDGKSHEVDITPSDTSDDIKKKIEAKTGMKVPTQVFKRAGQEIPDGKTVKEMGITEGEKLSVEVFRVPVTVNTMDGKQIKVMVDPTDTLGAIKKQLEKESGLAPDNQKLFMDGNELGDDGKTAEDYGIKAGSELDLEPKKMVVNIEMPDGTTNEVEISPSDTGSKIKAKIETETGMTAPRQVLKHNGKDIFDGMTAKDAGLQPGSTIKVQVKKIPIKITTMDGEQISAMIDPSKNLSAIKKQISKDCGLPASNQRLFLNLHKLQKELTDDTKSCTDLGIKEGSELDLEPKTIKINAELPDGTSHEVEISPHDKADQVKAKIQEATGMDVPRQVLSFNGQELDSENKKSVKDMGIREGSNIKVDIFKIPITVKTKDGNSIRLKVEPTETVASLKKTLKAETGMEPKKQCLKFDKKELTEDRGALNKFGVQAESVLTLEPHMDSIIFVDIKKGSLFAVDRDEVIEKGALTPNQGNKLDFLEAVQDSASKEKILGHMKGSKTLGVAPQVVVEAMEIEDYDLAEAESVKNKFGVQLKKRSKNKKGEEFLFVDAKTGACGELSRKKYVDSGFVNDDRYNLDTMEYDQHILTIRNIFGVHHVA